MVEERAAALDEKLKTHGEDWTASMPQKFLSGPQPPKPEKVNKETEKPAEGAAAAAPAEGAAAAAPAEGAAAAAPAEGAAPAEAPAAAAPA
jgi:hypothetical protein